LGSQGYARTGRHSLGMTLIELLAALGIVGVLASIGFGAYAGYAERVRIGQAVTEIGQIQLEIASFSTRPDRLSLGLPDELSELDLDAALLTDPWGRPYQYRRDDARLNRDYDLFSLGSDGLTDRSPESPEAFDDIVRGAGGSFIGTRADYAAITGAETSRFSTARSPDARGAGSGTRASESRFVR
jgi:prepilin-type N-terminal cleavage/methylation domain-containing protein